VKVRVGIGVLVAALATIPAGARDVAAGGDAAPPPESEVRAVLSPKARDAFDKLMTADRFESAAVGDGGSLSTYAAAVRTLVRERDAPAVFQALYDRGSVVARLYALAAFWYLRPGEFVALVRDTRARDGATRVTTQNGCLIGEETVAKLLESGARNAVRLTPGSGLYAFMCPLVRSKKGVTSDIIGGAVPIDIVEGRPIEAARCKHPPPLPDYLKPRR
jgi:hypothetical protein